MSQQPKFDLVLYHGGCPDGFTSAWVFKHYFPMIQIRGCRYGVDPPNVSGRRVAIVDFSFPRDQTLKMIDQAEYLVVLDHHESAQKNLVGLDQEIDPQKGEIIFDMKRAGAQISWDYLYPTQKRPWFIEYVADRDLWTKKLPYTEELSLAMWFDGYFQDFCLLENLFEKVPRLGNNLKVHPIISRGTSLLQCKNMDVKNYANLAAPVTFTTPSGQYQVRMVICPRQYRSDVGNAITSIFPDCDFAVIYWYDHYNDEWWISLRGSATCQYNLSSITNDLPTGGGHPKASGFSITSGKSIGDYFTNPEAINVSPKPLAIPNMLDYVNREIDGYLKNARETHLHLNDHTYSTRLACAPIHHHRRVLEDLKSKTDSLIKGVFWYDFGRHLWTVRVVSDQLNLLNLLGPHPTSYLGIYPNLLTNDTLEWTINDSYGDGLKKFFNRNL